LPFSPVSLNYPAMTTVSDRRFAIFNTLFSGAAIAFLGWLLLVNRGTDGSTDLHFVPLMNAVLNASSAILLVSGVQAIKRGNRQLHMRLVLGALFCSALFLAGYVAYHAVHGDTPYPGTGLIRTVYLVILLTHVVLSIFVLPLALTCLYLAYQERFDTHRRIARVTFPIWLYVSVTGVVIYFMLHGSRI
jgi:putative membrane protein